MKYKRLNDLITEKYHNDNIYSTLEYFYLNMDQILDIDYGKDNKELYNSLALIRISIDEIFTYYAEMISNIYSILHFGAIEANNNLELSSYFRTMATRLIRDILISFSSINTIKENSEMFKFITEQMQPYFNNICKTDLNFLLSYFDDYDLKYNKDKFLFPNFVLSTDPTYYFIDKYIYKENIGTEWYNDIHKDFLNLDKEDE